MPAARRDRPLTRLLATMAGLIAWAAQFTVIYGATALACARGHADTRILGLEVVPLTVLVATAAALAVTAFVLAAGLRERRRMGPGAHPTDCFLTDATILISALSLVVIAWHGLPALLVPPCW